MVKMVTNELHTIGSMRAYAIAQRMFKRQQQSMKEAPRSLVAASTAYVFSEHLWPAC